MINLIGSQETCILDLTHDINFMGVKLSQLPAGGPYR